MVTIIINVCSDRLSETTFMGNFMGNNKGFLNQSEHMEDLDRSVYHDPILFLYFGLI